MGGPRSLWGSNEGLLFGFGSELAVVTAVLKNLPFTR